MRQSHQICKAALDGADRPTLDSRACNRGKRHDQFSGRHRFEQTNIALTDRARPKARADRFFTLSNKTEETDG